LITVAIIIIDQKKLFDFLYSILFKYKDILLIQCFLVIKNLIVDYKLDNKNDNNFHNCEIIIEN